MSKVPGFRSGKTWKKVIATVVYLVIALTVYGGIKNSRDSVATSATYPAVQPAAKTSAEIKADADKVAADKVIADAKAAEDQKAVTAAKDQRMKDDAKNIPYETMARTPDANDGQKVKYTGKVIQVQESGDKIALRVDVTKTSNGYKDTMYVTYTKKAGEGRILDDDIINLWGNSQGLFTYKTVLGAEATIPSVKATIIEVVK